MSYKCRPSQFMSDTYCENSNIDLQCLQGQLLTIYSAFYGRTASGHTVPNCNDNEGPPILDDCQFDAVKLVSAKCHSKSSCTFNVTDEFMRITITNHICPMDVKKHLTLVYMCVDESVFDKDYLSITETENDMKNLLQQSNDSLMKNNKEERLAIGGTYKKSLNDAASDYSDEYSSIQQVPLLKNSGKFLDTEVDARKGRHSSFNDKRVNFTNSDTKICSIESRINDSAEKNQRYLCGAPNAIVYFYQWKAFKDFLIENQAELIRYFCISAGLGTMLAITYCAIDRAIAYYQHQKHQADGDYSNDHSDKADSSSLKLNDTYCKNNEYGSSSPKCKKNITNNGANGSGRYNRNSSPVMPLNKQYYLTSSSRNGSSLYSNGAPDNGGGFYRPAPDRASIDYMAIGSPLGATSLLEDEYYV